MAIKLEQFAKANNITSLDFNMNPATNRAIVEYMNPQGQVCKLVTKPLTEFSKDKPIYVYDCMERSVDTETGEEITTVVPNVHILSNKTGAVAAFSIKF
jgi:hypothetical protein